MTLTRNELLSVGELSAWLHWILVKVKKVWVLTVLLRTKFHSAQRRCATLFVLRRTPRRSLIQPKQTECLRRTRQKIQGACVF